MNILVATGIYPPEIGGPATYAALIERELPQEGIDIQVLPFSSAGRYPKGIKHLRYFFKVLQMARKADIVYALDSVSVGLPAVLAAKLTRTPFIIRLGGDYAWEQYRLRYTSNTTLEDFWEKDTSVPFFVRLLRYVQSFVTRRAVAVIAPSNYLKQIITKWGVDEARIKVIYSVLNPIKVEKERESIRIERNFTYPTICTAGRLVPWKGFEGVLHAVAKLKQQYPNTLLLIAGDGQQEEVLGETVRSLGLQQSVRLVGRLPGAELAEVVKGSDVFLLNTGYEGLSHQLVEVMAQGTPIVTTRVGGNPELITDGENGVLVTYNNVEELATAVTKVLEDKQQTIVMVEHAKKTVDNFSKETMIRSLVAVLKQYA